MSKYDSLWKWISENENSDFNLTYTQIEEIAGIRIAKTKLCKKWKHL